MKARVIISFPFWRLYGKDEIYCMFYYVYLLRAVLREGTKCF